MVDISKIQSLRPTYYCVYSSFQLGFFQIDPWANNFCKRVSSQKWGCWGQEVPECGFWGKTPSIQQWTGLGSRLLETSKRPFPAWKKMAPILKFCASPEFGKFLPFFSFDLIWTFGLEGPRAITLTPWALSLQISVTLNNPVKEKFLALNIYWLFNDLNTYLCSLKLWNLNRFAEFEMNLLICLREDFMKYYLEVNRMPMEKSRMQVRS